MKVFIIAAITADGFIARHSNHLADWTSREDKKLFVTLTKDAGVMVMGSRTFATIGRALPGRHTIIYTTKPENVAAHEGIETTSESPKALVSRQKAIGAAGIAICGGAAIYDLFMRAGVVDEIYLVIEPKIFGKGIQLFMDDLNIDLALNESRKLNDNTVLLHYTVLKH